jgi:hypothetical protein
MAAEFGSLVDTGTFEYTNLPEGRKVVTCKWVFSVKRNQWNEFECFKARLVARGFTQIFGIDYNETFAPVVKFTSLRVMFAVAAYYGLTIYQMDVVTAFLNAELDEEIYMSQPPVFRQNSMHRVMKWYCGFTNLSTASSKPPGSGIAS